MTVIAAAFRNEDDYAIGADQQAEMNGARVIGVTKAFRWGRVLYGGHGTSAQLQRAQRWLRTQEPPVDRESFLVAMEALRGVLLMHVGAPVMHEVAGVGVGFLFVGPWGIVEVDSAGACTDPGPMWACGSGGPEARGAMWALRSACDAYAPRLLVTAGVNAAVALDVGCGGEPVVLLSGDL